MKPETLGTLLQLYRHLYMLDCERSKRDQGGKTKVRGLLDPHFSYSSPLRAYLLFAASRSESQLRNELSSVIEEVHDAVFGVKKRHLSSRVFRMKKKAKTDQFSKTYNLSKQSINKDSGMNLTVNDVDAGSLPVLREKARSRKIKASQSPPLMQLGHPLA